MSETPPSSPTIDLFATICTYHISEGHTRELISTIRDTGTLIKFNTYHPKDVTLVNAFLKQQTILTREEENKLVDKMRADIKNLNPQNSTDKEKLIRLYQLLHQCIKKKAETPSADQATRDQIKDETNEKIQKITQW